MRLKPKKYTFLILLHMHFTKLVPNVFYVDINDALQLFIDCLEFSIEHDELTSKQPFCVIEKNSLRINLFENEAITKFWVQTFAICFAERFAVYIFKRLLINLPVLDSF